MTDELRALTGARGIAALAVVLAHLGLGRYAVFQPLLCPDAAVDFFFCLSGFTLCYAYRAGGVEGLDMPAYLRARFARIYPLYVIALVLMWWMVARHLGNSGFYPTALYHADALRQALMVNEWPLIGSGINWDLPAWSLSVEAFCYLAVFPPLFALTARTARLPDAVLLCLLVLCIFVPIIGFVRYWSGVLALFTPGAAAPPIAHWIPLIRGVFMFAAGWIVYLFWRRAGAIRIAAAEACDALALALVCFQFAAFLGLVYGEFLVWIVPALVLGLAAAERSVACRLLASPPLHFLGEISYALYLLHVPVDYELHHDWPGLAARPVFDAALTLGLVLLLAAASTYWLELPLRHWIKSAGRLKPALP